MITKIHLLLFIPIILCLESAIYTWSAWTARLNEGNYFYIEHSYIFDKCARISGRVSATLNLVILLMAGVLGLKHIYIDDTKLGIFLTLITGFGINHLAHFFYLYQNFKRHAMKLKIGENRHGFITSISILLLPIIIWLYRRLDIIIYTLIIMHLLNVSYVIIDVFNNKVKQGRKAYHNKFGIWVTVIACTNLIIRIFLEV